MSGPRVAVVVPFYQQERGILARALESAASQRCDADLDLLVVDDGSPVPAADEIDSVDLSGLRSVRNVVQTNAGPAAARNRALDEIGTDTDFVAFLDSDDRWDPTHVASALTALASGYDVFFGNFLQVDQDVGAFERAGRIVASDHRPLDDGDRLFGFDGSMIRQILSGNVIGTPTVVYRWPEYRAVRFRESFVYAGEDYLFWLDLAASGASFAFTDRIEVRCGRGVNIFTGSGWGTERSLDRIASELRFLAAVLREFDLDPDVRASVRARLEDRRRAFVLDVLHRLRHGKSPRPALVARQLREDPVLLAKLPLLIPRAIFGKSGR